MFNEKQGIYYFNTENDLNNIESLSHFLDEILFMSDEFELDQDSTQAYIWNIESGEEIVLDSYGNGDFYSHIIEWYIKEG